MWHVSCKISVCDTFLSFVLRFINPERMCIDMWRSKSLAILGWAIAASLVLAADTSASAENLYGYNDYGVGDDYYYGFNNRDLEYRPKFPVSPTPPRPDFGPARPYFPHDVRVSGSQWHLFAPRYKAFPGWSGYNDTYPRGTGTEVFYIRPGYYFY